MANVLMTRIAKKPRKVKPPKAKPRIKKKKVLTPKQRSRAAKKGWKNRKKREREFLRKARKDQQTKGGLAPEIVGQIVHAIEASKIMLMIEPFDREHKEAALEQIIQMYAAQNLVQIEEDPEQVAIRTRLRIADSEGNLEEIMELIQREYGMSPQEVYTEWLYSGVQ